MVPASIKIINFVLFERDAGFLCKQKSKSVILKIIDSWFVQLIRDMKVFESFL